MKVIPALFLGCLAMVFMVMVPVIFSDMGENQPPASVSPSATAPLLTDLVGLEMRLPGNWKQLYYISTTYQEDTDGARVAMFGPPNAECSGDRIQFGACAPSLRVVREIRPDDYTLGLLDGIADPCGATLKEVERLVVGGGTDFTTFRATCGSGGPYAGARILLLNAETRGMIIVGLNLPPGVEEALKDARLG